MMPSYQSFKFNCADDQKELVMARLYELGFEAFQEEENSLEAYISDEQLKSNDPDDLQDLFRELNIEVKQFEHETKDWNKVWESNFSDLIINQKLHIRAEFHPKNSSIQDELIIAPKMAFGTGHHQTTCMILEWMTEQHWQGKRILDFGCGTGILGIYAKLKGAALLSLIDIEPQAIDNVHDTLKLNNSSADHILLGSIDQIPPMKYDVIFANITRNILLEFMDQLVLHLDHDSRLILSGFLSSDESAMIAKVESLGMNVIDRRQQLDWLCLVCRYN